MTFSPGPWQIKPGSGCLHVVSKDDSMHTGCITFDGNGAANARLIAAAPELYEAAREAIAYHDARAAITTCGCEVCESFRPLLARIDGDGQ